MTEQTPDRRNSPDPEMRKKRYEPPELTAYGSLAKLTQATTIGSRGDNGTAPVNKRV